MGKVRIANQTEPATPSTGRTTIYVDDTTKKLQSKDDAGVVTVYGQPAVIGDIDDSILSTTLVTPGNVSINAGDDTKFDLSAGVGYVVDAHTDPLNPVVTQVVFGPFTEEETPYLTTNEITFVMVDINGSLFLTPDQITEEQYRDYFFVGTLLHTGNTVIQAVNDIVVGTPINLAACLNDLQFAMGPINKSGNVYSANASDLEIKKTEGEYFFFGLNYKTNKKAPNLLEIPEFIPGNITRAWRDGSGGWKTSAFITEVNPNRYDDGTGGASQPNGVVPSGKWTIQKIWTNSSLVNISPVQYGQKVYASLAEALDGVSTEQPETNPIFDTILFRTWLIIKQGATDLSDPGQAQFVTAGKFGDTSAGVSGDVTTLQNAYDNGSEPEIKLNTTRGAVSIQDADTPIADNLLEVKNSGGTQDIFSVEANRVDCTEKVRTSGDGLAWEDLRVPLESTKAGGAKAPGFAKIIDNGAGSQGVYSFHFDKNTEEELFFSIQMPHSWIQGTDIHPHIHWMPEDTDTGSVVWGLEYTWVNFGDVMGNTTILEVTDPADGTALKHQIAEWSIISGAGKTFSSMLMCRIFRVAGDAADTYDSDCIALEFDVHYQINSLGSEEEYTKTP